MYKYGLFCGHRYNHIFVYLFESVFILIAKNRINYFGKKPTMHGDVETDKLINSIKVKTKY